MSNPKKRKEVPTTLDGNRDFHKNNIQDNEGAVMHTVPENNIIPLGESYLSWEGEEARRFAERDLASTFDDMLRYQFGNIHPDTIRRAFEAALDRAEPWPMPELDELLAGLDDVPPVDGWHGGYTSLADQVDELPLNDQRIFKMTCETLLVRQGYLTLDDRVRVARNFVSEHLDFQTIEEEEAGR